MLTDTDRIILDKIKEIQDQHGEFAQEWVLRDRLRKVMEKKEISWSLRKLHSWGYIKMNPNVYKAWMINLDNVELQSIMNMPRPKPTSKVELTLTIADSCIRKFKEKHGMFPTSTQIVETCRENYGEPDEKCPDRKIRKWGKRKLLERYGTPPKFTYDIPKSRNKQLYQERPLMMYGEE